MVFFIETISYVQCQQTAGMFQVLYLYIFVSQKYMNTQISNGIINIENMNNRKLTFYVFQ